LALPQFAAWGVDGVALNSQGISNGEQMDAMSIVMFGFIFELDAIWSACDVITNTSWVACATTSTTWSASAVINNTTWTLR
jgi:hypothetical protein